MKNLKRLLLFLICASIAFSVPAAGVSAQDPQTQNQATALMRGYRTGYSDGYQAGVNDLASNATREFRTKPEYDHADRAYNSNYGTLEEYRDGYQQGFEAGYNAGYDRKQEPSYEQEHRSEPKRWTLAVDWECQLDSARHGHGGGVAEWRFDRRVTKGRSLSGASD